MRPGRPSRLAVAAGLLPLAGSAACAFPGPAPAVRAGVVPAVASISAWGSILAQLGGSHVRATSVITNPNTDPHDYEPTPATGRVVASSLLFVENGVGYDSWAGKVLAASPDPRRVVIDAGRLTGIPADGNPHRWYSPGSVLAVAAAITAGLKQLDPADAGYFDGRHRAFVATRLAAYRRLIADLRARYAGTPVGASESIFAPLAAALGLDLRTPPSFLKAISEGSEPSAADKATIDSQIAGHRIKVYVVNRQNATPDVAAQVRAARAHGIPVVSITETLTPATASFEQWQVAQLRALEAALHRATGR